VSQNGNPTTQVQNATGPSWALPYQQFGANQAYSQFSGVNSPQQLVAPFSSQQNQAISGITNLATNGTPETSSAQNYVTNVLNGGAASPGVSGAYNQFAMGGVPAISSADQYAQNVLNGNPAQNPYLNSMFNQAANSVQNRLSSEFAGSGRNIVGSLPQQADELNNLATQLYGGAYNTGVQQQEQALSSYGSPLAQAQIGALGNLYGSGVQQQENALTQAVPLEQQQFNAQQNLYNAGVPIQNLAQNYITAPQQFLQQYLNQVNQIPGQSIATQQPLSPAQQAAQTGAYANIGGTLGGTLGNMFGGSSGQNWGSLLGSIAGAIA